MADVPTAHRESFRYDWVVDLDSENILSKSVRYTGANKRVLELGCATGYVSKVLRERGCSVVGIEIDEEAAARAAAFCERIVVGDLEALNFEQELGEDRFDVVVATEVLEHLKDPVTCLRSVKSFLRRDGYVVVSVPNVAHGSVRLALLEGRFRYTDTGLLDQTHLRFFTRQSVEELFDDAGFAIVRLERVEVPIKNNDVQYDLAGLPPGLEEWLARDLDAHTYQFVVVAYPLFDGEPGVFRERVRELIAENDRLLGEIHRLTVENAAPEHQSAGLIPTSNGRVERGASSNGTVHGLARQQAEKRATIVELHTQLAERDDQIRYLQAQAHGALTEIESLREHLRLKDDDLRALHELVDGKERESERYVGSLREHLEASQAGARSLRMSLDAMATEIDSLREQIATRETALATVLEQGRTREAGHADQLAAVRSELVAAECRLREIAESKLWRLGAWYWGIRDRLMT